MPSGESTGASSTCCHPHARAPPEHVPTRATQWSSRRTWRELRSRVARDLLWVRLYEGTVFVVHALGDRASHTGQRDYGDLSFGRLCSDCCSPRFFFFFFK